MATSQQAHKKAILTETPPSVGNQEVLLDPKIFNDFITGHSYECLIERRMYCPCININTGQPLPDCLNCGGTGKFYINKQKSMITCQNIGNRNKYESWSITNVGVVNITAMPADKMGFEDRVTLTELEMWFSEVLQLRTSNDGITIFAFTKYFPVNVFFAYNFQNVNSPLTYVDRANYTVTDNKIVFNKSVFGPLMPVNVSICYTTNPSYLIIDINRDLVKTIAGTCNTITDITSKKNLPLNYVARLLHIIPDQPSFNGLSLYDNTNYGVKPPNFDAGSNGSVNIVANNNSGNSPGPYPFILPINGSGTFNISAAQHMISVVKGILLLSPAGNVVTVQTNIDPLTQNVQIISLINLVNYKIVIF